MTDPLHLLEQDRHLAREATDPMVDRCVLGTPHRAQGVSLRTLVLREIDDRLAVFYSRTSSKHAELLENQCRASLLIFLPTIGVQYRLDAVLEEIPKSVIESHWQLKPNAAKRMDAIYERRPQSTVIDDYDAFETLFAATVPPRKAPANGTGCYIEPWRVERLELKTDPHMHDRKLFELQDDEWHVQQLVP